MNIDEFVDEEINEEVNEEVNEWEGGYQISSASGKPLSMKNSRKKAMASWQRIEQLKDEATLNKQVTQDNYSYFE